MYMYLSSGYTVDFHMAIFIPTRILQWRTSWIRPPTVWGTKGRSKERIIKTLLAGIYLIFVLLYVHCTLQWPFCLVTFNLPRTRTHTDTDQNCGQSLIFIYKIWERSNLGSKIYCSFIHSFIHVSFLHPFLPPSLLFLFLHSHSIYVYENSITFLELCFTYVATSPALSGCVPVVTVL